MIRKLLSVIVLTLISLVHMNPIEPDVSYTGKNDRYDLTDMVSANKKMFRDTPLVDDDEGGVNNRRNLHNTDTVKFLKNIQPPRVNLTQRDDINFTSKPDNLTTSDGAGDHDIAFKRHSSKNNSEIFVDAFKKENHTQANLTRGADGTFAEDDSKNSFEGGTVSDFENNLKHFQVNKFVRRTKLGGGDEFLEHIFMRNIPYSNDN